jgi:hypothetical protein
MSRSKQLSVARAFLKAGLAVNGHSKTFCNYSGEEVWIPMGLTHLRPEAKKPKPHAVMRRQDTQRRVMRTAGKPSAPDWWTR